MSFLTSAVKSDYNSSKHQIQDASSDIANEFKSFVCEIEDLIKSSSAFTGDELSKTKEQLNKHIKKARNSLDAASGNILQNARRTAALTNQYVHQQPWTVVGTSAALSFLVGYLLASRD